VGAQAVVGAWGRETRKALLGRKWSARGRRAGDERFLERAWEASGFWSGRRMRRASGGFDFCIESAGSGTGTGRRRRATHEEGTTPALKE